MRLRDLVGDTFTRWFVISRAANNERGQSMWNCRCSCGETKVVLGNNLRQGLSRSCGCLSRETTGKTHRKHGECNKSKLYGVWSAMKQRCLNSNNKDYNRYGGRGITICDDWLDYIPFRDWALANSYAEGLTIDRRDNDGNYEPSNCRWVTMLAQAANKSR